MKRIAKPTSNAQPIAAQTPRILTVQQVADLLQIPKTSIYEKTRNRGNHGVTPPLPCRRVGKYLRFFDSEVMQWLITLPQNEFTQRKRRQA